MFTHSSMAIIATLKYVKICECNAKTLVSVCLNALCIRIFALFSNKLLFSYNGLTFTCTIIINNIIIIITDPQIAEVMNALVADKNKSSATTGNNTVFFYFM